MQLGLVPNLFYVSHWQKLYLEKNNSNKTMKYFKYYVAFYSFAFLIRNSLNFCSSSEFSKLGAYNFFGKSRLLPTVFESYLFVCYLTIWKSWAIWLLTAHKKAMLSYLCWSTVKIYLYLYWYAILNCMIFVLWCILNVIQSVLEFSAAHNMTACHKTILSKAYQE